MPGRPPTTTTGGRVRARPPFPYKAKRIPMDDETYAVPCPGRSDAEPCGEPAYLLAHTKAYLSLVVECGACGLKFEVVSGVARRLKTKNHAPDARCICCGRDEDGGAP